MRQRSSACQKSLRLFQTRFKNAVTFVSHSATKVQAAPVARLAQQGLARHSILFEEGFAPSSSPMHFGSFSANDSSLTD